MNQYHEFFTLETPENIFKKQITLKKQLKHAQHVISVQKIIIDGLFQQISALADAINPNTKAILDTDNHELC